MTNLLFWQRTVRVSFVMLAAVLIFAATASAAVPIYWTPTKMSKALIALQFPHQGTFSGVCKGAGKARKGAFAAFRCSMGWQLAGPPLQSGKQTVWAKPMSGGRVCASTSSLKACRLLAKRPLADDPTKCQVNDPTACAQAASKAAIVAKHGGQVNLACTQGSDVYHWACTSSGGPYTVVWSKGVSQWNARVTP